MVKLEIRNLESSKSHLIDAGGAVLGREGGDAQIKLADQGVSKKHARIYAKRGTWYLEDLDSANGTYLEDERITAPAVLSPGVVFTMSRQQFEVVQIVTEEPEPTRSPRNGGEDDHLEPNAMEPGDPPDRLRASRGGRRPAGKSGGRQQRMEDDDPPPTDHSTDARAQNAEPDSDELDDLDDPPVRGRGARASAGAGRGVQSAARAQPQDSDVPAPSFAYFATAVPRAVAYYLKSVPLMAVNPLGTIRKGIAEQPLPALSNLELVAYAFPALLFSALVNAVCAAILAAFSHTFTVGMLFPVMPLVSAAVGAIVSGFLCHPVLTWVVNKLGGDSDARSRSNMFVMSMTASALLAFPSGLAVLLTIIRVPFINLLPLVLSVVASLVLLFLLFSWFRYFGVVQWFEYVVLGLGALLVLNAAYGLVMTTLNSFRGGGVSPGAVATGSVPVVAVPGEPPDVTALRQKMAEAAAAGDQAAAERLSRELAAKLARYAMERGETESAPVAAASRMDEDPPPPPTTPGAAAASPGGRSPGPAEAPPPPGEEPPPPAMPPPPVPTPPPATTPAASGGPGETRTASARAGKPTFPEYRAMRTEVEKTIADDPTLLRRQEILNLYRELVAETRQAEDRFRSNEKGPAAAVINARLREADVYDRTWRVVTDLNRRLFP